MQGSDTRVLIVDDDDHLRSACARSLRKTSYQIEGEPSAGRALERLKHGEKFDVILTDIRMPDLDGIGLLRAVREFDLDVPLIIMTGDPTFETAVETIQYGGFRYLVKPIDPEELVKTVRAAVAMHHLAVLKRRALEVCSAEALSLGDRASLELYFGRALEQLWMAFQPIVDVTASRVFAYEALVRSTEPMMPHPGALFGAAERLGRLHDLGRSIRRAVAARIADVQDGVQLFVNLHAEDLNDPELFDARSPLAQHAARIVLEVTERASLEGVRDVRSKIGELRALGYRIAVDDLGAGYAGLSSFSQLEPEVVKLDMSLVRGIDGSSRRQSLVRSLLDLCANELRTEVVCEGVETEPEKRSLEGMRARLLQGYLFGRPDRQFTDPF